MTHRQQLQVTSSNPLEKLKHSSLIKSVFPQRRYTSPLKEQGSEELPLWNMTGRMSSRWFDFESNEETSGS
jgi:hypothetical protein